MTPQGAIPSTPPAWLEEIAKAYCDAYETLPFGKFVGREIKPEDLFESNLKGLLDLVNKYNRMQK